MESLLDHFYARYGNYVFRDNEGNPSVYVRHHKMKSSDFDPILPAHTHPAFVFGENEDDDIYIGKYMSSSLTSGGTLLSLPNAEISHDAYTVVDAISKLRQAGDGFGGMTIADFGLLVLMAQAFPDKMAKMQGNTNFSSSGRYYGEQTGGLPTWNGNGLKMTAGKHYVHGGIEYKCLVTHTSSIDYSPENYPLYWEMIQRAGGVPDSTRHDTIKSYKTTLTGSGPVSWNFLADERMEADLLGNANERLFGIMLNGAELNIIPNNDAALAETDLSSTSAAWRAILPHANDNGHDFVAPGTAGTLKLIKADGKATWVARAVEDSEYPSSTFGTKFDDVVVDTATIPYTPYILYELGLLPLPGKSIYGTYSIGTAKNTKRYVIYGTNALRSGESPAFSIWAGGYDNANNEAATRSRYRITTN